ncbi:hypothetical protein Sfulv_61700 [Streptomyces fulvorobeus]|uniref:Uncharacterized protein n=1 Tax=Streptomyces fulvorobeus TaxID=284028 RepID=A0A7J0CFT5_9ACTN|nr:hypothetical protein Sfulv_61700 [Streptomyces fulvorobeus]
MAFGQRVVTKHLHRERKKHRESNVLPDQQAQVLNGQSSDRPAPQGMRRRDEAGGVRRGRLPVITFKLLKGRTTVDRYSHQTILP